MPKRLALFLVVLCLTLGLPVLVHKSAQAPVETARGAAPPPRELVERSSSRDWRVVIEERSVEYTATAGDAVLRVEEGEPRAKITYVSYLRKGVEDRTACPLAFAFNGGPDSASLWVHLGVFGPKLALLDEEGFPGGPPPGGLVDSEYSFLDATGLVFDDPIETGRSRPAPRPSEAPAGGGGAR